MTKSTENKNIPKPPSYSFRLEAERSRHGMSVIISGIIGINDFTDERVLLKSHGGRITVSGKRLTVSVFEHNCVEIVGKVEDIGFGYGKN